MVYVAPSKVVHGGKSGAQKNAKKGNKGRGEDALASKADLLAKLTREAEEHTRILERERAALGLPIRVHQNDRQQPRPQPHQQHPQGQHADAGKARNRRRNYHVFTDQGNKKVFDPRNVPGLSGPDAAAYARAGGGGHGAAAAPAPFDVTDADQTLNQTFPDSPNYYPGRVFAVPDAIPPPPNQPPQLPRPDEATIVVAPWRAPPMAQAGGVGAAGGLAMPGQPPWLRQGQPPLPSSHGVAPPPPAMGGMMPMGGYGGPALRSPMRAGPPPGLGNPAAIGADPRVAARMEAEARKEAYRRELEEQIRAKKQAKEVEGRRRREEDAAWEARAGAAPQPWDPEARGRRRGGGGDPIRDDFGRPVANLRQRGGGQASPMGMGPSVVGGQQGLPPSPMGPAGSYFPASLGPGRLTVEIPGGPGAFPGAGGDGGIQPLPFPMDGQGALGPPSQGHRPLMPLPRGATPQGPHPGPGIGPGGFHMGDAFEGPPPGLLSPSNIPPVSPGNRRFMAAMNDLIAGPSAEQRRQKEMSRQRLQLDLEEQIREKRERQARERAEMERQRLKEDAELKRQAEQQRLPAAVGAVPGGGPRSPQPQPLQKRESSGGGGGGMDGGRPPLPPRRHGRGGKIIDASWLDAPKAPPAGLVLPPLSSLPAPPQMSPRPLPYSRRASAGLADEVVAGGGGGDVGVMSPGSGPPVRRAPSHDGAVSSGGAGGAGRSNVTLLLQQLQEDQSRMREDVARQAVAMEQLADEASRALADRNEAWKELQRVKAVLAGSPKAMALAAPVVDSSGYGDDDDGDGLEDAYDIGPVIVNTHILPKTSNCIPDALPKPVSSEVLRRGRTHPGQVGGGGLYGGGGGGAGRGGIPLSPLARSGSSGGHGLYGGAYGGGSGYGDMASLQDGPLNLLHNVGRRSGIPLPPGMPHVRAAPQQPHPHPAHQQQPRAAPQRIQSVYGYGFDTSPPKSRYNSFFGLDQGEVVSARPSRGDVGAGLPSLGPRKPPPIKPPPSPAILRGDHLPSPMKQMRGPLQHQHSQVGGASRTRSGRVVRGRGSGGRGRAASAVPVQSLAKLTPELPPIVPTPRPTVVAAAVVHPASQRSLEGMQKVLLQGHEEWLLRGVSDDSGGLETSTELVVEDQLLLSAQSEQGRRQRSREDSLPGETAMMSPGTAADYLGGGGGITVGVGVGGVATGGVGVGVGRRSFYSDSIASYRALLTQRSVGTTSEPVASLEITAAAARSDSVRPSDAAGNDGGGADGGAGSTGGGVGGGPVAANRELQSSWTDSRGISASGVPLISTPETRRSIKRAGGDSGGEGGGEASSAAAAAVARTVSAISAVSEAESHISDMPMRRPVRAGRRASLQRAVTPPLSRDDGSTVICADGDLADLTSGNAGVVVDSVASPT